MEKTVGCAIYPEGTAGIMKSKHIHVVFCGMDGTGKTTLAKFATDWLKRHGRSVVFVHGHGYSVSQTSFGASESWVRRIRRFLYFLVPFAYADNLLTYVLTYRPILKQSDLVSDRYFYDKVVRLMYYGVIGFTAARVLLRLLPRPSVVFFLDADTKVVTNRKNEYTEKELKSFHRFYHYCGNALNATIVDTNLPINKCREQIVHTLLTKI